MPHQYSGFDRIKEAVSLWVLIGVATSLSVQSLHAQDDANPYVYYHDREKNTFIVSTITGEDARPLVSFTVDESFPFEMGLYGPGWSSSGDFFAWNICRVIGAPGLAKSIFILESANSEIATISVEDEPNQEIADVQWSPTEDLLLITTHDFTDVLTFSVGVYSLAHSEYLFTIPHPDIAHYHHPPRQVRWSADGQYIILIFYDLIQVLSVETQEIVTLAIRPLTSNIVADLPYVFDNNRILYASPLSYDLVLYDFEQHQEVFTIPALGELRAIDWSPNQHYALIHLQDGNLWLLDIPQAEAKHVTETENTNLDLRIEEPWSEDSGAVVFVTSDQSLTLLFTDLTTMDIPLPFESEISMGSRIQWRNPNELFFTAPDKDSSQFELYRYSANTGELVNLSATLFDPPRPAGYFSVYDEMLVVSGGVVNLETNEFVSFTNPQNLGVDARRTDKVIWHPSGEWLFLLAMVDYQYYILPADIHGNTYPRLGICPLESQACLGWLPAETPVPRAE